MAKNLPKLVPLETASSSGTIWPVTDYNYIKNGVETPDNNFIRTAANPVGYIMYRLLNTLIPDLGKLATLTVRLRYKIDSLTNDTETLLAAVSLNGPVLITNEVTVATRTTSLAVTNSPDLPVTINTTGLSLDPYSITSLHVYLRTTHAANMGGDGSYWSIDEVEVNGTYYVAPSLSQAFITNLTTTSFTANAEITSVNDTATHIVERGFYWVNYDGIPNRNDAKISETGTFGTGSYSLNFSGLTPEGIYSIRPYAITNEGAIGYGTIFTVGVPTVVAPTIQLNNPPNSATEISLTPLLQFTGTDDLNNDIDYLVEILNSNPTLDEIRPAANANYYWRCNSIKMVGSEVRALAGVGGTSLGRLYFYNGSTWVEQQPAGDVNMFWRSCSLDFDGTTVRMFASGSSTTISNQRLYYYNGISWAETQPLGNVTKTWGGCSISFSGSNVRMMVFHSTSSSDGRLYYFNGSSWSEIQPTGNFTREWIDCQIKIVGSDERMIAVAYGYVCTYNGSTWSISSEYLGYSCCSLDFDGTNLRMLYGIKYSQVFLWNGSQWVQQYELPIQTQSWWFCSVSFYNGNLRMIIGADAGRLYYYNGSGWQQKQPAGNSNLDWNSCSVSIYQNKIVAIAGVWGGRLYMLNEDIHLSKVSISDSNFSNTVKPIDTRPFASGDMVQYSVQSADSLQPGTTYYWRACAYDQVLWSDWSNVFSFTTTSGSGPILTLGHPWMIIYGLALLISLQISQKIFENPTHSICETHIVEDAEFEILD